MLGRVGLTAVAAVAALAGGCGPVNPGGNDNPCGLPEPGCEDEGREYVCDGPDVTTRNCASFEVCADGLGCVERVCTLGQVECVDTDTERRCIPPGHAWEEVDCTGGVACTPGQGCEPRICSEGERVCLGPDDVGICNDRGTDYDPLLQCSDTDPSSICHDGQCVSACERAALTQSYLGCEYWAVDLPQYPNNVGGKDFAIVVSNPSESETAEVTVSDENGVVATLSGPFHLQAGEMAEFGILEHVELSSDKPFYVGQFIRSSNGSECASEADPAFILQVPVAQFRRDYVFLTPETYTTDYLAIIAPPGATVTLDGNPLNLDSATVGASAYSVTDVVLTPDGPHRLDASDKVGIIVYGYGGPDGADPNGVVNVSYGYPGGLDLAAINPVE